MQEVNEAGFYWALWLSASPGTTDADEQEWPRENWEVVEVWENFTGPTCEADKSEKWGVSVCGVENTQWLENFNWGSKVERS